MYIYIYIFNISFSQKNISIRTDRQYKIQQLISKVENLVKRIRWKALEFLGKLLTSNQVNFTISE